MKYVIVGGDERFACLEQILRKQGIDVYRITGRANVAEDITAVRKADGIVMNYPVRGDAGDFNCQKIMDCASEKSAIYLCGPSKFDLKDERIIDLWQDETLLNDNAELTAEGAVATVMQAGTRSICDSTCLVIGWGRIGRALTEILVGMGAKVVVASRSQAGRNRAIERGALAVNTDYLRLKGFYVVFSTPPAMVLNGEILKKADRDVMIVDLASPPYGVDLKAAWDCGLRAWREPGLPGRYCPESAALAIFRAIQRSRGGYI